MDVAEDEGARVIHCIWPVAGSRENDADEVQREREYEEFPRNEFSILEQSP